MAMKTPQEMTPAEYRRYSDEMEKKAGEYVARAEQIKKLEALQDVERPGLIDYLKTTPQKQSRLDGNRWLQYRLTPGNLVKKAFTYLRKAAPDCIKVVESIDEATVIPVLKEAGGKHLIQLVETIDAAAAIVFLKERGLDRHIDRKDVIDDAKVKEALEAKKLDKEKLDECRGKGKEALIPIYLGADEKAPESADSAA